MYLCIPEGKAPSLGDLPLPLHLWPPGVAIDNIPFPVGQMVCGNASPTRNNSIYHWGHQPRCLSAGGSQAYYFPANIQPSFRQVGPLWVWIICPLQTSSPYSQPLPSPYLVIHANNGRQVFIFKLSKHKQFHCFFRDHRVTFPLFRLWLP